MSNKNIVVTNPLDIEFNLWFNPWFDNSGTTGYFNIINSGDSNFENWELEFTTNAQIGDLATDIWNAQIVSVSFNEGLYKYVIDFPENRDLESGESYSFEFNTKKSSPVITNLLLNGQALEINIPEPKPEPESEPETHVEQPFGGGSNYGEVERPDYNKSTGFFTLNGKIYDANGNEFIARGINNMHVWFDHGDQPLALNALDNIADFGFNSVRIVWEVDHGGRITNDSLLENIIEETIGNSMVPQVELHDFTAEYESDFNDTNDLLNRGVKWWTDRAEIWQKYEESLMINIANEFGDWNLAQGDSRAEFPRVYKEAITRIRNAGINNTIIIDPFDWGKDYSLVAEYGREIYEHDPQQNVVFSVHFYSLAGENQELIHEAFDSIAGQGLPMIVGEFGTRRNGSSLNIQEEYIMSQAEEYGVGTYPWAWHGDLHAIATHWEASLDNELTDFGKNVVFGDNGVQETSELATIFEDFQV